MRGLEKNYQANVKKLLRNNDFYTTPELGNIDVEVGKGPFPDITRRRFIQKGHRHWTVPFLFSSPD